MRILLPTILFIVAGVHARILDVSEESSKKSSRLPIKFNTYDGKNRWYPSGKMTSDPQPVLNDTMFATVEEYPDGYTGHYCSQYKRGFFAITGDIRYTMDYCSQHVWECVGEKLFKKTCPGSSVFWFAKATCEPTISNEPTCSQKQKRGQFWPLDFVQAAQVKNLDTPTEDPLLITTDCTPYQAAFFPIKQCHSEYVQCWGGVRQLESCRNGFVVDETRQACVPPKSCGATPSLRFDDSPQSQEFIRKLQPSEPIWLTVDCNKKADGIYELGKCYPTVVSCQMGRRGLQSCTDGEVYGLNLKCVEKTTCEEAYAKEEVERVATPAVEPTEDLSLPPIVKECPEGIFAEYATKPCHSEYLRCSSIRGEKLKCSEGFVFSRRFKQCIGKEFCDE